MQNAPSLVTCKKIHSDEVTVVNKKGEKKKEKKGNFLGSIGLSLQQNEVESNNI